MQTGRHAKEPAAARAARRYLPPLLLTAGIAIFITAFFLGNTGGDDTLTVTGNPAVEALTPEPGTEVLRQSQVGIDLAPGYEAELVINDIPIPLDEVNVLRAEDDPERSAEVAGAFDTSLSRFLYQPLEGRAIPELKADENCAVATFWPIADPTNIDSVRWCFTVA